MAPAYDPGNAGRGHGDDEIVPEFVGGYLMVVIWIKIRIN